MVEFEKQYVASGKVLLAFHQFPLESMHPFALKAAEGDVCAAKQGKAFEMHDLLFGDQANLDIASLQDRARKLNLNEKSFSACLDANDTVNQVRQDQSGAKALGVVGTPTFFVGLLQSDGKVKVSKRMSGAITMASLQKLIDPLLTATPPTGGQ